MRSQTLNFGGESRFQSSHRNVAAGPKIRINADNLVRRCSVVAVKKARIDAVLAERGIFPSRSAAAAAVRAGQVRLGQDGPLALRPSQMVEPAAGLIIRPGRRYVSRGGIKLENALKVLPIEVSKRDCVDVGASTGGFVDCLLQRGAARVAAVDVAFGQLDLKLRENVCVSPIERLNARKLEPADLPFVPSFATVDVSFISLAKVLPAIARCLAPDGEILALVKPQFELGRERVGKGVVHHPQDRREAILGVVDVIRAIGLPVKGFASSGLPGPKGNRETFVWSGGSGSQPDDLEAAILRVEPDR